MPIINDVTDYCRVRNLDINNLEKVTAVINIEFPKSNGWTYDVLSDSIIIYEEEVIIP